MGSNYDKQGICCFTKITKRSKFTIMAKSIKTAIKKKASKKRASTYEPKVKFNGTFEEMIAISTTGAGVCNNYV